MILLRFPLKVLLEIFELWLKPKGITHNLIASQRMGRIYQIIG